MCRGLASLSTTCLVSAKELKARLSSFLQKSHWSLQNFSQKGKLAKLNDVEPFKRKECFESLLRSKDGLSAFQAFLVSEYSEENIAFYLACEDYRRTKSTAKLAAKAKKIYEEFIQSDAPKEVNIDQTTRDDTMKNLAQANPACFDAAQLKIYTLMEKDCYPRFLRSAFCQGYRTLLAKKT